MVSHSIRASNQSLPFSTMAMSSEQVTILYSEHCKCGSGAQGAPRGLWLLLRHPNLLVC